MKKGILTDALFHLYLKKLSYISPEIKPLF